MFAHDTEPDRTSQPLLRPHETPPYEIINADSSNDMLLVCDHASRKVPESLHDLGLPTFEFDRHIAYDIGTEKVTRNLSRALDCTAVLARFSRLVLDVNRPPGHPESIPEVSDGTEVPANLGLSEAEKDQRVESLHDPYHDAIGHALAHIWNRGRPPALFSVHSFTPLFGGTIRPWDVGVLWKHDPRLAVPLMEKLRAHGLNVGDNEPYSGLDLAYTIDVHGGAAGLANCVIEINQDQVFTEAGIERWSAILIESLGEIISDERLYRVEKY